MCVFNDNPRCFVYTNATFTLKHVTQKAITDYVITAEVALY